MIAAEISDVKDRSIASNTQTHSEEAGKSEQISSSDAQSSPTSATKTLSTRNLRKIEDRFDLIVSNPRRPINPVNRDTKFLLHRQRRSARRLKRRSSDSSESEEESANDTEDEEMAKQKSSNITLHSSVNETSFIIDLLQSAKQDSAALSKVQLYLEFLKLKNERYRWQVDLVKARTLEKFVSSKSLGLAPSEACLPSSMEAAGELKALKEVCKLYHEEPVKAQSPQDSEDSDLDPIASAHADAPKKSASRIIFKSPSNQKPRRGRPRKFPIKQMSEQVNK